MGCDIHAHWEVKINNKWEHASFCEGTRSYKFFSKIAGVRGNEEPISLPKGLPDDITTITKIDADYWDIDGHSHSWLNAKEVEIVFNWYIEVLKEQIDKFNVYEFASDWGGYLFGEFYWHIYEHKMYGVQDIRFVFWFDN